MNTDRHGLEHEKLTHEIIGCAMEVLNGLGHGLIEKPYENSLVVEFGLSKEQLLKKKHPCTSVSIRGSKKEKRTTDEHG